MRVVAISLKPEWRPEYTHLIKKDFFLELGVILRSLPENNVLTSTIA